ncbi:hypothetical protein [Streptomyces sp. NPDC004134]|uniref:TetR/AcrR family transcriptional regulator n=1 Tax=Streptomyces sp. NPDC004134 TaxID=3364691 RepID=UPI0036AA4A45
MSEAAQAGSAAPGNLAARADALFREAVSGPRAQLGENLLRMSLTAWENPELRPRLLARVQDATSSAEGAEYLREHFSALLVTRLGEVVDVPRLRLNALVVQVVGLIMLRYVLKMEPIASASVDELVETFAPTLQGYLSE